MLTGDRLRGSVNSGSIYDSGADVEVEVELDRPALEDASLLFMEPASAPAATEAESPLLSVFASSDDGAAMSAQLAAGGSIYGAEAEAEDARLVASIYGGAEDEADSAAADEAASALVDRAVTPDALAPLPLLPTFPMQMTEDPAAAAAAAPDPDEASLLPTFVMQPTPMEPVGDHLAATAAGGAGSAQLASLLGPGQIDVDIFANEEEEEEEEFSNEEEEEVFSAEEEQGEAGGDAAPLPNGDTTGADEADDR